VHERSFQRYAQKVNGADVRDRLELPKRKPGELAQGLPVGLDGGHKVHAVRLRGGRLKSLHAMVPRDCHHDLPGPLYRTTLKWRLATADLRLIAQAIAV